MTKGVLITGATGFIGQHLLEELQSDNYFCYALSRQKRDDITENVAYIKADISDVEKYKHVLLKVQYIVHVAGEKKDEALMHQTNVAGTEKLLEMLKDNPAVKLIVVGSAGVYGIERHPEKTITEQSECYPSNTYEKTKFLAEERVRSSGHKNYMIVRPSNIFGEGDNGQKLLNLLRTVKNNRFYYVNKSAMLNYVYVKQVTGLIKFIIDEDCFTNDVVNCNAPCTIFEFIEKTKIFLKKETKTKTIPLVLRPLLKLGVWMAPILQKKIRKIDKGKYRELTAEKQYSVKKMEQLTGTNTKKQLFIGLKNLVHYYNAKGLL